MLPTGLSRNRTLRRAERFNAFEFRIFNFSFCLENYLHSAVIRVHITHQAHQHEEKQNKE